MGAPVVADPVDNPGDAYFYDSTGANPFWQLPNGEWLELSYTMGFGAQVDGAGNLTSFAGSTIPFLVTQQLINGAPLLARLEITNITGTVNFSSGAAIDWTITARASFQASTAFVFGDTCKTGSFTFHIQGGLTGGTADFAFIPALTGTGTGACGGRAADINTALELGNIEKTTLFIDKWAAINTLTQLPLTGSP